MEELSRALQPYKEAVGTVTSVLTIAQFFAGCLICKDIYKKKSTQGMSVMPFLGGTVIGVLMLKYSLMLNDPAMLVVNQAAVVLNLSYTIFYYFYCQNKFVEVLKPTGYGIALAAVLLGYTQWEDEKLLEYRFGLILTVMMLILLGSPLMEVNSIIKKQDSSCIPFPITFTATIVSFLWLVYGIILLNYFMVFQNVLGLVICGAQVALCYIYPSKSAMKAD